MQTMKIINIEDVPYSENKYVTIEIDNKIYQGIVMRKESEALIC